MRLAFNSGCCFAAPALSAPAAPAGAFIALLNRPTPVRRLVEIPPLRSVKKPPSAYKIPRKGPSNGALLPLVSFRID